MKALPGWITVASKFRHRNDAPVVSSRSWQSRESNGLFVVTRAQDTGKIPADSLGYGFMLLSATGVVFLPTTAKFAFEAGSNVLTVAVTRGVIATLILFGAALLVGRSLRLPRALLIPSLVVGVASALFVYGILGAILTINISLALLILFLYPLGIALYEHASGVARLLPAQWLYGIVAIAGLGLMLGVRFDAISFVGVAHALLAMLATVVLTLLNVRVVAVTGSLVANLYMSFWTLLIFAAVLALIGTVAWPQTPLGWGGLLGNGVAYCVSWVAFFAGAGILGATRASMFTLFEPALAAFVAWLIFGENFSLPQWAGFAVVLVALYRFEMLARLRS